MYEHLQTLLVAIIGVVGLGVGYFIGQRHGRVVGELTALKSRRSERPRRRQRLSDEEFVTEPELATTVAELD